MPAIAYGKNLELPGNLSYIFNSSRFYVTLFSFFLSESTK